MAPVRWTTASSAAGSRPAAMRVAPAAARRIAVARPMPLVAPVTRQTAPRTSTVRVSLHLVVGAAARDARAGPGRPQEPAGGGTRRGSASRTHRGAPRQRPGRRADGHRRARPAGDPPVDPAVRRANDLHHLERPVLPQAGAHQGEPQGRRVDQRSQCRERRPVPAGHDPGRRHGRRRGPALRLGTASAPHVAQEGAGHRLLPGQAGRPSAVLRTGCDRDPAATGVPLAGRPDLRAPAHLRVRGGGAMSTRSPSLRAWRRAATPDAPTALLGRLEGNFTHALVAFVDPKGYPLSVATGFDVDLERGVVMLDRIAGDDVAPPRGREVNVVFSHIRPQPGVGYDERRYISMWGRLEPSEDRMVFS